MEMRKINKLFAIVLCCVGAMSLVSCIDSDDGIDSKTYQQYLTSIAGNYSGATSDYRYENKLKFYNDTITDKNNPNKIDSIMSVMGSVRMDSSFVITGVQGKVLALNFPDEYKDLKEAIEKAPDQTITGKFVFASVGQTSLMMLYPEPIVYPELTYGGQTHKNITINFWGPSGGYFTNSSYIRVLELPVFMAYVYEGDKKLFSICDDVNNPSKAIYGQLFVTLSR